jgi:hypothetical protein
MYCNLDTATSWTSECKNTLETTMLPNLLNVYNLSSSEIKCIAGKIYADFPNPSETNNALLIKTYNTYMPACKSSNTVLIIIIVLIILGAIAGTVFYLKHKGVLKL